MPESTHIRVQFLDSEIFHVDARPTDTILDVKRKVFAKEPSMPVDKQVLSLKAQALADDQTCAFYKITKDSLLLLSLRFSEPHVASHAFRYTYSIVCLSNCVCIKTLCESKVVFSLCVSYSN